MAFNKKTWTDRVAEFINRRSITHEDGSEELVTVARSEGTVSQEGDAFNAATMNDLEERIEDEFESINSNLTNSRKILWENPTPNASFNPQTINLLTDDYDELEFVLKNQADGDNAYTEKIEKGYTLYTARVQTNPSTVTGATILDRGYDRVSDTEYAVGEGRVQNTTSVRRVNNNVCTPVKIYGIKHYSS